MQQSTRRWRQVGVWLPAAFIAATAAVAVLGLGQVISDVAVVAVIAGLGAVGAAVFSRWIFQTLGRAQQETDERARELAAVTSGNAQARLRAIDATLAVVRDALKIYSTYSEEGHLQKRTPTLKSTSA